MRALVFLAASFATASCVAYNDQCQALVENPTERVALLGAEVFLDRPNTRHNPNAIGQAAADAFVDVFADSVRPVDFAVINGGALRAEGLCVTRNIVPAGGLTNGVLHEILLFENLINAVDLTEDEVIALFEHSSERLFTAPNPIISPAGSFLQVSKEVAMTIDCTQAPSTATTVGSRVTALTIKGEAVQRPGRATKTWRVALPFFLLNGGDGYTMLAGPGTNPDRNPAQAQRFGGVDSNITADYLRRTWNKDPGLKVDPARVVFAVALSADGGTADGGTPSCSRATRPAN